MKVNEDIVIGPFETVELVDAQGNKVEVKALIDTGARVSSVDKALIESLGIFNDKEVLYYGRYSSALGEQKRPVVELTYFLAGKKIASKVNVSDRSKRSRKFLVGRRDLEGFLVKVVIGDDVK